MGIGMVFGGMAEGLGGGIMAAGKQAEASALAAQKSEMNLNAQLQLLDAKRGAQMEIMLAKMEAKNASGGGGGGGKADPIDPALAGEFAAYETASTGAQVAQRRAIARGEAPTRDIMGATMPSAAEADTAATGPGGEDYSDRMSRTMQQAGAKPAIIGKELDQAALDDYKANAAQMVSSLRRSANPKESKNMAEAGLLDQRRGLVDQYSKGGGGPGEAALLGDGKPAFNKEVSLATGKSTEVGRSEINKNNGAATRDRADATDKTEGGVKPKDQAEWLGNERKSIDTARVDLRKREADLADIVKTATMTDEQKKAEKAALVEERAGIVRRERAWDAMSEKVGASIMGATTKGTSAPSSSGGRGLVGSRAGNPDTNAEGERRYILERELSEEIDRPLNAKYTAKMKEENIERYKRELGNLEKNGFAKIDTSRMPGAPKPMDIQMRPLYAPAAPAAAAPAKAAPAAAAAAPGAYKSPDDVKLAYQAGKIDKNAARAALSTFGFK